MQNTTPMPMRFMVGPFLTSATCLFAAILAFNTGHIPSGIFLLLAAVITVPLMYVWRNRAWQAGQLAVPPRSRQ